MDIVRLKQQIDFIKEIDKIKYINRKTKLFNSNRYENNGEHSWHLAMMVMVLAENSNEKIDVLKVLKMVLIHDIVEIDSGDIPIFDTTKNHSNYKEELKAANRIFGILPKDQAQEMISIWTEFEDAKTPEAKFAKAMDRFEPLLQNASNEGGTWTDYKVKSAKVFKVQKEIDKGSNTLWDYSENLINECIEKGILQK